MPRSLLRLAALSAAFAILTQLSIATFEQRPSGDTAIAAAAHAFAGHVHSVVGALFALLLVATVVGSRAVAQFATGCPRALRWAVVPLSLLGIGVLLLPVTAWDHALEAAYELEADSWSVWLQDQVVALIALVVGGTAAYGAFRLGVRLSPVRWWPGVALLTPILVVLTVMLAPLFESPTAERQPLAAVSPPLLADIHRLLARAAIEVPDDRIFVEHHAGTGLNARVEGLGATRAIVIWDTALAAATPDEVLFVLAHELGHQALGHLGAMTALAGVGVAALSLVGCWLLRRLLQWRGERWQITGPKDVAALPLLAWIALALLVAVMPLGFAVSRQIERDADIYGLELIHGIVADGGEVAARYFGNSGVLNLSETDPSPLVELLFFDHPSRRERIATARSYDPWRNGQPPRFIR
jgi:Zn-dependent protease with chaperone function